MRDTEQLFPPRGGEGVKGKGALKARNAPHCL